MDKKAYPFKVLDDGLIFEFESISPQKTVRKVVEFSEFDVKNLFNLALFDVSDDGQFSDLSVTDNGDMENILSTVIQTIQVFLALHPKAKVLFMGSTKSRNRLYRAVIAKYFYVIEQIYEIHGITEWKNESFEKNKDYDAFMIFLKISKN